MNIKQTFAKQVEQETKQFRKDVEKMEKSDNPYYTDDVVAYETDQRRQELESRVSEINSQFEKEIDAQIEQQERVAARSTFRPTTADKQLVDEYIQELIADATFAYTDSDRLEALDKFEEKIGHFEEGGLYEVKKRLPEVARSLQGNEFMQKKLRGIHRTFSELQTPEKELLDDLKDAKSTGVDMTFRRLKMTHKAYNAQQKARKG
ncbi:hypothetical protein [Halobacillus campisalis]|uniref:Uncharacterized protein n=1 Tax=Halobacillus campisalis TaxID=435909 RepID=A0ABW2K769_9BACI|nr:hypothetical protein [Halobacillus campisalis]